MAETGEKTKGEEMPEARDSKENPVGQAYTSISPGPLTGKTRMEGLRIDFNYGARIQVPEGAWRVQVIDMRTFQILLDGTYSDTTVLTDARYYIPWRVEVWQGEQMVFSHTMELRGRRVYVQFMSGALGDSIAWLPYVEEFRKRQDCEIWVSMSREVADLFREVYPKLRFVAPGERPGAFYASYYLGCFFPPENRVDQPSSWKIAGVQGAAANILGLPPAPIRPDLRRECPRTVEEPYVCIATQATAQAKYWNNPEGWFELISWLKGKGYRVLCIDKDRFYGNGWHFNGIPWGAEDFTGARPLRERLELLIHADFFVGLGSGLSWLAWAAGIPVVLISGFSLPHTEFPTPYRIINYNVCNGCWEDDRYAFAHDDFFWCPRHEGDGERQFECTRMINHIQVIRACEELMREHGLGPER